MITAKEASIPAEDYVEKKIRERAKEGFTCCIIDTDKINKKIIRKLKKKRFKVKYVSIDYKAFYKISW